MTNKSLTVGILGFGNIAEESHLPVLLNNSNIEVKWVCDQSVNRRLHAKEIYGIKGIESEFFEKYLDEVDLCLVTIPYGVRKPFLAILSEKKKRVLLEKPFAFSNSELNDLKTQFPGDNQLIIGLQRRFYHSTLAIKMLFQNNFFGKLHKVVLFHSYLNVKSGKSFITKKELAGGGILAESGIHPLDQLFYALEVYGCRIEQKNTLNHQELDFHTDGKGVLLSEERSIDFEFCFSRLLSKGNYFELHFENATCFIKDTCAADIIVQPFADSLGHGKVKLTPDEIITNGAVYTDQAFYMLWDLVSSANNQSKSQAIAANLFNTKALIDFVSQFYSNKVS